MIVFEKAGEFVVRACPGSGKTFSVAARLAHRLENWGQLYRGIAALSFTNVAWKEIEKKLNEHFNIVGTLGYPHFLGTLDSFINTYIFLPYGHLVMGCPNRPILVGAPHSDWGIKRYDRDYEQYFSVVSLGINDQLVYPEIQGTFFFGFNLIYKQDGSESAHATNLRSCKSKYWAKGYATQHDANYFALKLLHKYPGIAKAVAYRFSELILDEAQDTNDIQMQILEILNAVGLKEMMLVGDPDQAIFEWNNAKPSLFSDKYKLWEHNSIPLNQNRRSSQLICNTTFHLSTLGGISESVDDTVCQCDINPEVVVYSQETITATIENFIEKCKQYKIPVLPENIAVICRSQNFVSALSGGIPLAHSHWTDDFQYTYPILKSLCLYHRGFLKEAFRIMELPFCKLVKQLDNVTRQDAQNLEIEYGMFKYRKIIYSFIRKFPSTYATGEEFLKNLKIVFPRFKILLQINNDAKTLCIQKLFAGSEKSLATKDFTTGTVHSVKGETYEAVLLFLKKKGIGRNYTTMIQQNVSIIDEEELRIIYVGVTRPRKFLMIAAPDEVNKNAWLAKLKIT